MRYFKCQAQWPAQNRRVINISSSEQHRLCWTRMGQLMGVYNISKPHTPPHGGKLSRKVQTCSPASKWTPQYPVKSSGEQPHFSSDLHLGQRKLGWTFVQTVIVEGVFQHTSLGMAQNASLTTENSGYPILGTLPSPHEHGQMTSFSWFIVTQRVWW